VAAAAAQVVPRSCELEAARPGSTTRTVTPAAQVDAQAAPAVRADATIEPAVPGAAEAPRS
jgi:hypothetical protein